MKTLNRQAALAALFAFSLSAIAVPNRNTTTMDQARHLVENPREFLSYGSNLVEQHERAGWRFETRPGERLVLSPNPTAPLNNFYITPPASSGMDLAFRVTRLSSLQSPLRVAIAAFNRNFTQVLSRRVVDVSSASTPEEARIQFQQTMSSLANELSTNPVVQRSAQLEEKSFWKKIANTIMPNAFADEQPSPAQILVYVLEGAVAVCAVSFAIAILLDSTNGSFIARVALSAVPVIFGAVVLLMIEGFADMVRQDLQRRSRNGY